MKWDPLAQRFAASALIIISIAICTGAFAWSYTQVASTPGWQAKAQVQQQQKR